MTKNIYVILVLLLSACASTIKEKNIKPLTSNAIFPTSEEESRLIKRSNRLHQTFVEKGLLVRSQLANDFVSDIADKIAPQFQHPDISLNFFILKDASINAFALPNGNIYLNVGLIAKLSSNSQLAYVISHEISHVIQRHGLKQLVDRKNTIVTSHVADLFLFGTGFIYFATVADLASHSREMENEADNKGISYLTKTDFNLNAGEESLRRLQEVKYKKEGTSVWSTHPNIEERIAHHKTYINRIGWQLTAQASSHSEYELFRRPLAELVIKIRLRNKQFELAQDVIEQELESLPESALLHYYLAEANRLKASEIPAYAREYAWLHDEKNNEKLISKLSKDRQQYFDNAKASYLKAKALKHDMNIANKGLGLLALNQNDIEQAKLFLEQYLQANDIKDRRYINSLLSEI